MPAQLKVAGWKFIKQAQRPRRCRFCGERVRLFDSCYRSGNAVACVSCYIDQCREALGV